VRTLVLVGALNGLILPLALAVMLVAAHRARIVGTYRHPRTLTVAGVIVAVAMAAAGGFVLWRDIPTLMR
jgi:Mn2+/Fe2+ NRAMP family transporter